MTTPVSRNDLLAIIYLGAAKVKDSYGQFRESFPVPTQEPDKRILMSELGLTDQFMTEVVKQTKAKQKNAVWDFSKNESTSGSDMEVQYQSDQKTTSGAAMKGAVFLQAKVMQHTNDGQWADLLYESGRTIINFQCELLANWAASKRSTGMLAAAYYIIYDDKDILYVNAEKAFAWMNKFIRDATNVPKLTMAQWNATITGALAKTTIDAADAVTF